MSDKIDIGHGVTIEFCVNSDGTECGFIERHPCSEPDPDAGHWVGFRGAPGAEAHPGWVVESREPLTEFSLEAFLDDEDEPPTCKTLRTLSG